MPEAGQEQPQPRLSPKEAVGNFLDKHRNHAMATGVGILNALYATPEIGEAIYDFASGNKALGISKGIRTALFAAFNTGAIAKLENNWHKAQNRQNT